MKYAFSLFLLTTKKKIYQIMLITVLIVFIYSIKQTKKCVFKKIISLFDWKLTFQSVPHDKLFLLDLFSNHVHKQQQQQ